MNNREFNDIIDYAVEKENEAIDFYSQLKDSVKLPAILDVLNDIINMEKGHINRLQQIRTADISQVSVKYSEPLNLSNYLEEKINYESLDYPALLLIAMKREEKAKNLYADLSNHVSDTELKKIFTILAEEEEQHKTQFEKIYDERVLIDN
jgi:rubrerythrin